MIAASDNLDDGTVIVVNRTYSTQGTCSSTYTVYVKEEHATDWAPTVVTAEEYEMLAAGKQHMDEEPEKSEEEPVRRSHAERKMLRCRRARNERCEKMWFPSLARPPPTSRRRNGAHNLFSGGPYPDDHSFHFFRDKSVVCDPTNFWWSSGAAF